jgi:hypothetical protein
MKPPVEAESHQNSLDVEKRARQQADYEAVRSGARTQESMFLLTSAIVKKMKVRHRTTDF